LKVLCPEFEIRKLFDYSERAHGKGNLMNQNHIAISKGSYKPNYKNNHIGGQVADETMPVWDKRVVRSELTLPLGFVLEDSFANKLREKRPDKSALTDRAPTKALFHSEIM
jgi:hypothetical protein